MRNNTLTYLALILVVILLVFVVLFSARQQKEESEISVSPEITEEPVSMGTDGLIEYSGIEAEWLVFEAPKRVNEAQFEVEFSFPQRLEQVDVNWEHPATGQKDEHTLRQFQSGNSKATYNAKAAFGNLLAGKNKYEIVGWVDKESEEVKERGNKESLSVGTEVEEGDGEDKQKNWEAMRVTFEVEFDLQDVGELNPEKVTFENLVEEIDDLELEIVGKLSEGVDEVWVYSSNKDSGKSSFTKLKKYEVGGLEFSYFAEERYDNLLSGDNLYLVELIKGEKEVVSRKYFNIKSNKLTYADEIENLFGTFTEEENGWYVSSKLSWFSFREVYESVFYEKDERNVILPRPTLMYTAQSAQDQPFCEYLGAFDYAEDGFSFRGYSYETCQKYSYGVSVYDRFLDALRYEAVKTIHPTEYKDLEGEVSSALVMIETGGMRGRLEDPEMFEDLDESFETDEKLDNEEESERKRYYVYQMLITEKVEYTEKKIGDIEEEFTEERGQMVDKIRELLASNSGMEFVKEANLIELESLN